MLSKKTRTFLHENGGNIFYPLVIIVAFLLYMLNIGTDIFDVGYVFLILYSAGMTFFEPFKPYFKRHHAMLHWVATIFIAILALGVAMLLLSKVATF
jgi:hypothetical protein